VLLSLVFTGFRRDSGDVAKWIVYVLKNPRTNAVRYVGWTSRGADARLQSHIYEALASQRTRRQRWILSLLSIGLIPTIEVIESGQGSGFADSERYWIAHYRARGTDLVNSTDGGDGPAPQWGTPEQRSAAIVKANASRTPEQRRAVIAKVKAGLTPEQGRANIDKVNASRTFEQHSAAMKKAKANMGVERVANQMDQARDTWLAQSTHEERSAIGKKNASLPRPNSRARWAALREAKKNKGQN
jgi:hypothetical protein